MKTRTLYNGLIALAFSSPAVLGVPDAMAAVTITPTVSGTGASPANPFATAPSPNGSFFFTSANILASPRSGAWYDPPFVSGFEYTVVGTTFQSVTPPTYSGATLIIGAINDGPIPAGGSSGLVNGVTGFGLINVSSAPDEGAPGFLNGYPVELSNNGAFTSLTITPIPIPEQGALALLASALPGIGAARLLRRDA